MAKGADSPDDVITGGSTTTTEALRKQWSNPKEVLAVLLIVGGDVIQKALAQFAGGLIPVAFSFGWVAYSFSTIISLVGDGRLMPEPDYSCKVINLDSGHARENKSWMIGRMLRDDEMLLNDEGLQITVYEGEASGTAWYQVGSPLFSLSSAIGLLVIIAQFLTASVPYFKWGDWRVILITGGGTFLSLLTASLPQWRAEKYACRKNSDKRIAITVGNGSRHVMIIKGTGNCLDLEDLAGAESPRVQRPWEAYGYFVSRPKPPEQRLVNQPAHDTASRETAQSTSRFNKASSMAAGERTESVSDPTASRRRTNTPRNQDEAEAQPQVKSTVGDHGIEEREKKKRKSPEKPVVRIWSKIPIDFHYTRLMCSILVLAWVALLISIGGLEEHAWFMFIVGGIGSLHNAYVAGTAMSPETRGFKLTGLYSVRGVKNMDVLMDLEIEDPGMGRALREEYFPAGVSEKKGETRLWNEQIPAQIQQRLNAGHYDRRTVERLEKMGYVQHISGRNQQQVAEMETEDYIATRNDDEKRRQNGVKLCN